MKSCVQSVNAQKRACDQCGNTPETIHAALFRKGQFCDKCCGCGECKSQAHATSTAAPAQRTISKDPFYKDDRREAGSSFLKPGGATDWLRSH